MPTRNDLPMNAVYLANGSLTVRSDYPRPVAQPGEALLRVRLAGICTTDLELVKGYAGFTGVLGHEFVAEVVAVQGPADEQARWNGRFVVGSINIGCGQCAICQQDGPEHCFQRQAVGIHGRDGAFADYLTLPVANLHELPAGVPVEAAVFTEPLAAALRIREQVVVGPGEKTAVVGPGRLGLLVGQVLALTGNEVVMVGRSQSSLALPAQLGLATALASDLPDSDFGLVVEATGNEAGFAQALRLVRPQGTVVLKSTFHASPRLDLTKLVVSEIKVVGSRCGPFAPALRLLASGAIATAPLIDAIYPLTDAPAAFAHAAQPGVRKILLRPAA